jgi:hypothetical protein
MITGFNPQGRFLTGGVTTGTHPYPSNTHINDGEVRFSSTHTSPGLDVCVGGQWQKWFGNTATVGLTSQAEAILVWAEAKMLEEQRIKELAQTNPTVADAAEALKKAEEQLRLVMTLSKTVSPV